MDVFRVRLASHYLQGGLGLQVSVYSVYVLEDCLVLFLYAIGYLRLFFRFFFVMDHILDNYVTLLFGGASGPFVEFLAFRGFRGASVEGVAVTSLVSTSHLQVRVSKVGLCKVILCYLHGLLFYLVDDFA